MQSIYDRYLANQSEAQILEQNKKAFDIHAARNLNATPIYKQPAPIEIKEDVAGWEFLDLDNLFGE